MFEYPRDILEKMNERAKRRRAVIWSSASIIGYIWDIIRNLIVISIILAVYDIIYDPASVVIISILILIYLSVVSMGAGLWQSFARTHLVIYAKVTEILQKLDKSREENQDEKEEFEKAEFMIDKIQYKFILNSIFNFIIFVIALFNLLGAL